MLQIRGLNQFYGGSHVLRGVDLDVPAGACTAVLGRNGMGKTTLLRCLMGLLPVRSGSITFGGKDIAGLPPYERARLGIGYVPQGREIFPRLTVAENLRVGEAAVRSAHSAESLDETEALFPALKTMRSRPGGNLSGGQQQQLAIARALVARPKLLLLDEPTEGIQP
ncbi:MAG TPA: ATP-binding cassette domain-containing protein, partial [Myxococcaceae bacterium]|nr:ATP-binding cassette domain-containing protein [Myxococcaceae bacterium]